MREFFWLHSFGCSLVFNYVTILTVDKAADEHLKLLGFTRSGPCFYFQISFRVLVGAYIGGSFHIVGSLELSLAMIEKLNLLKRHFLLKKLLNLY